jgi:hypothetical protein
MVPRCDAHALMLARHRDELQPYCRVMAADYDVRADIVNKDGLDRQAEAAGVSTIPSRAALLAFVAEGRMDALTVQQLIRGGDGYIFDCYGYCDGSGLIFGMASSGRATATATNCSDRCPQRRVGRQRPVVAVTMMVSNGSVFIQRIRAPDPQETLNPSVNQRQSQPVGGGGKRATHRG